MNVLLSDGSGLTSRQAATALARAGHTVDVLDASGFALTHLTNRVHAVHRMPPLGDDPNRWFDAAHRVIAGGGYDVLLPVQEQVAVLSRRADEIPIGLAVPDFAALRRVQDKVSAAGTLAELGLPQPWYVVARSAAELRAAPTPAYLKLPIGTASTSVWPVRGPSDLAARIAALQSAGSLSDGVLVQGAAAGPLAMVQSVFARGELVAWHATLRVRTGSSGSASSKRGVDVPEIGAHLARLGTALRWHGALSADAILTRDGPVYIDINPRLVEPVNALLSGVDLLDALLTVSCGQTPHPQPAGRAGVRTHQLLLAVLGAAARGRRAALQEFCAAAARTGPYRNSAEELTPLRGDLRSALPAAYLLGTILRDPRRAAALTQGSVRNYAMTPTGWRALITDTYDPAPRYEAEP